LHPGPGEAHNERHRAAEGGGTISKISVEIQWNVTLNSGILINQRVIGVSLGECDLNLVSAEEFRKIADVCGQPNGVGESTNKTTCHVREVFVPKKGTPGIVTIKKVISVTRGF
jgi:hypothetical protein